MTMFGQLEVTLWDLTGFTIPIPILKSVLIMTMFGQLEVTLWVDWVYNSNSNFKECINYDNVWSA